MVRKWAATLGQDVGVYLGLADTPPPHTHTEQSHTLILYCSQAAMEGAFWWLKTLATSGSY